MVSIAAFGDAATQLVSGLGPEDCARVQAALDFAFQAYGDRHASSGQSAFEFSLGAAVTLAHLRSDAETRILSCQIYISSMAHFAGMNEVWDTWVAQGHTPPRATVEAKLADPAGLVEIVVVAAQA